MYTSAAPHSTHRDANWLLQAVLQPVLLLATVAVGLAAGFFYAYTVSVTRGLAIVDDRTYVETMQAINSTVRNLPFALSFFGSVVLLVVAVSVGLSRPGRRWSPPTLLTLAALLLYGLGTFVVTFAFSVPLNDELAIYTDLASSDLRGARELRGRVEPLEPRAYLDGDGRARFARVGAAARAAHTAGQADRVARARP